MAIRLPISMLAENVKANRKKKQPKQICTTCGDDHWSPDCPETAKFVHSPEALRIKLQQMLDFARAQGYLPQLEIGLPASKRQTITVRDIYLKPLNGSDKLYCSCCSQPYEKRMDSFRGTLPNPLNWCNSCRELLREMSLGAALRKFDDARVGKAQLIQESVDRINAAIAKNKKPLTHSVK